MNQSTLERLISDAGEAKTPAELRAVVVNLALALLQINAEIERRDAAPVRQATLSFLDRKDKRR